MRIKQLIGILIITILCILTGCDLKNEKMKKIIFLHHSTGQAIWLGNTNHYLNKLFRKSDVGTYFKKYNRKHKTDYNISERNFPGYGPYGWSNDPYDYYNIWVKNAGDVPYKDEPTLEILTREYDIIIFKHCNPVSRILADSGNADINSKERRIENYKLQYDALKRKMHSFPGNKFILWTPTVNVKALITKEEAERTRQFYDWIKNDWDEKGDNIFIWDFYNYETNGGLYLLENNAVSPGNSHPNKQFSASMAPLFSQFIIDVIEGKEL